jgi:hypothetical protein
MSQPRGFGLNGKSFYTNIAKPMEVNCSFIVDSTNGNGLGIRSLKSNGYINNVFMNTSATPGTSRGSTNPNPIAGYALVQFTNNFTSYIDGFNGIIAPPTSTTTTSLTAGHVYQITSLGTTTTAQWVTAGLTPGFTPNLGTSFVAAATASLGGTGTVGVPGVSQITEVSVCGDPNQTLNNTSIATNSGAIVLVQFFAATSSSVTTQIVTAPANNSVVALTFLFDGSTVSIDGL